MSKISKEEIHNIWLHTTGRAQGLIEAGAKADVPVMFAECILEYTGNKIIILEQQVKRLKEIIENRIDMDNALSKMS